MNLLILCVLSKQMDDFFIEGNQNSSYIAWKQFYGTIYIRDAVFFFISTQSLQASCIWYVASSYSTDLMVFNSLFVKCESTYHAGAIVFLSDGISMIYRACFDLCYGEDISCLIMVNKHGIYNESQFSSMINLKCNQILSHDCHDLVMSDNNFSVCTMKTPCAFSKQFGINCSIGFCTFSKTNALQNVFDFPKLSSNVFRYSNIIDISCQKLLNASENSIIVFQFCVFKSYFNTTTVAEENVILLNCYYDYSIDFTMIKVHNSTQTSFPNTISQKQISCSGSFDLKENRSNIEISEKIFHMGYYYDISIRNCLFWKLNTHTHGGAIKLLLSSIYVKISESTFQHCISFSSSSLLEGGAIYIWCFGGSIEMSKSCGINCLSSSGLFCSIEVDKGSASLNNMDISECSNTLLGFTYNSICIHKSFISSFSGNASHNCNMQCPFIYFSALNANISYSTCYSNSVSERMLLSANNLFLSHSNFVSNYNHESAIMLQFDGVISQSVFKNNSKSVFCMGLGSSVFIDCTFDFAPSSHLATFISPIILNNPTTIFLSDQKQQCMIPKSPTKSILPYILIGILITIIIVSMIIFFTKFISLKSQFNNHVLITTQVMEDFG